MAEEKKSKAVNLQDDFLTDLSERKSTVAVYLINGIKLQGIIESFDQYVLVLSSSGTNQMVYKHAISTIVPASAPAKMTTVSASPRSRYFFNEDDDNHNA